jgi:hypothetical protein
MHTLHCIYSYQYITQCSHTVRQSVGRSKNSKIRSETQDYLSSATLDFNKNWCRNRKYRTVSGNNVKFSFCRLVHLLQEWLHGVTSRISFLVRHVYSAISAQEK